MDPSLPPLPPRDTGRLARRRFDVLIIGGGINGAGIARDLVLRGFRVALAEQGDFASGTSSASTKLIHGGVRYLENFDFRLVFEACRERRILRAIAPHLVRPLPFFIPVYREDPRPLWLIRAGMTLYDLLALFRNAGRHSILAPERAVAEEPALRPEGLTGVARYWDCRTDDARLCLENVIAAAEGGAEVFNYLQATALLRQGGKVRGARLADLETGGEVEVEAEAVVNAAGPWLDRVRTLAGERGEKLRLSRGTHILVPRLNRGEEALYLTAGRDDRLFFVIPWGDLSLVGTTDVDYDGDPDRVAPTSGDVDYLLAEAGRHLSGAEPGRNDVVAAFAGLRPLLAGEGTPGRLSREHRVFQPDSGLISVGGGKYTTYRAVAAEVGEAVAARLGRDRGRSLTDRIPLPGGTTGRMGPFLERSLRQLAGDGILSANQLERLLGRYGSRTRQMLALLREEPELARPLAPGSSLLGLEVAWAVDREFARTPEDVLRRRTGLALERGRGLAEVEGVAELMAGRLGADAGRRRSWVNDYRQRHEDLFGKD